MLDPSASTQPERPGETQPETVSTANRHPVPDILERIVARRRRAIAAAMRQVSLAEWERLAARRRDFRDFTAALAPDDATRIIAEIKRASPSRGRFATGLDPRRLACAYETGGAAALSVLTEPDAFLGSADDLQAARSATDLPVLRKDFIICPYQVYESAAMGADALLLIVRILDEATLVDLLQRTRETGLAALVEIHDAEDARRLAGLPVPLVGINNRDLSTFKTDLAVSRRLSSTLGADRIVVAASGIFSRTDVLAAEAAGINRFLVGESLVRSGDPAGMLRILRGDIDNSTPGGDPDGLPPPPRPVARREPRSRNAHHADRS